MPTQATHRVDDFVTGVKEQASNLKSKYVDGTWTNARGYIQKNPGKTILFSVATGLVIGTLLRRR